MEKPEDYPKYTREIKITLQSHDKSVLDQGWIDLMDHLKKIQKKQEEEDVPKEEYLWLNITGELK